MKVGRGGISYHQLINRYFTKAREEIARIIGTSLDSVDLSEPIDLTALPLGKRRAIEEVYRRLGTELSLLLQSSIGNAWQSTTATQERRTPFRLTRDERASINSHNLEALRAFKSREVGGLTLSSRIWQYVGQEKAMMEACLTRVIRERRAPEDVRRLFIKYLNLPEEMKRYIAGERNPQKRQEAMRAFTAGRGVYLDPLKNIERLLRTEINRATKTADYEWMQRNPYIIGYRIKRSQRHKETPCEACDKLQGEYPKTFKFVGWHPNCSCIVEPIFATGEERKQIRREISQALKDGRQPSSVQAPSRIDELPPAFSQHYARYQTLGIIPRVLDEALAPYHEAQQLSLQVKLLSRQERKALRLEAKSKLLSLNLRDGIKISNSAIKEWINQPHRHKADKDKAILNIKEILEQAKYLGAGIDKHDPMVKVHIYETHLNQEKSWIIVREFPDGAKLLHSISDNSTLLEKALTK